MQEEKAIVVDENDNVIEYRERSKLTNHDRIRITAIWIEDGKGSVLIQKRSKKKSFEPGLWEMAAGGLVAHDETYETNAYKELSEEIGVSGVDLEFVAKTISHPPAAKRYCSWYRAVVDWPMNKFTIETKEVEELKWVKKDELFNDFNKNPEKYTSPCKYWRELFS